VKTAEPTKPFLIHTKAKAAERAERAEPFRFFRK
jgi:hypothetical protein